jgi:hypothetical protein
MNPPLIKTTYVLGDKIKPITIAWNGLNANVEIKGNIYTKIMPPHDFLKDHDIADVLATVLAIRPAR